MSFPRHSLFKTATNSFILRLCGLQSLACRILGLLSKHSKPHLLGYDRCRYRHRLKLWIVIYLGVRLHIVCNARTFDLSKISQTHRQCCLRLWWMACSRQWISDQFSLLLNWISPPNKSMMSFFVQLLQLLFSF
jgi:hypothetical protein